MKSIWVRFSTIERDLTCFLIRTGTWSEWSHVDVCLPEGLLGAHCDSGVAIRPFDYEPKARYIYYEIRNLTDDQERLIRQFLIDQIHKRYDYGAILGDILRRDWRSDGKWFCSELVAAAFEKGGAPLLNPSIAVDRISPRDLTLSPYLEQREGPPSWAVNQLRTGYQPVASSTAA